MIGRGRPSRPDATRLGLRTSLINLSSAAHPIASAADLAPAPRAHLDVPAPPLASPDDTSRRRQRKEKHWALAQKPSSLASCYGTMHMAEEAVPGYYACCKLTFQMF